jgi:hypothetical protein
MDKKEEKTIEKNLDLKEKICPLNPKLKCEDCRLYQPYLGGGEKQECAFKIMSSNIAFMANTWR